MVIFLPNFGYGVGGVPVHMIFEQQPRKIPPGRNPREFFNRKSRYFKCTRMCGNYVPFILAPPAFETGVFILFFRCMRYEVKHASSLYVYGCCAHAHVHRSLKIIVSIHWTLQSNFHFLPHPQILHCLKSIANY